MTGAFGQARTVGRLSLRIEKEIRGTITKNNGLHKDNRSNIKQSGRRLNLDEISLGIDSLDGACQPSDRRSEK